MNIPYLKSMYDPESKTKFADSNPNSLNYVLNAGVSWNSKRE